VARSTDRAERAEPAEDHQTGGAAVNRWILAALIVLSSVCGASPVIAQEPTTIEAATCTRIVIWFADGFARAPRKGVASTEPYLVVYNGQSSAQDVTITVRRNGLEPIVRVITVSPQRRQTVDLYTLVGRIDTDFAVEVEFAGFGTADLKMWSAGQATPSLGLPLCR
jgi:hypothetical protein